MAERRKFHERVSGSRNQNQDLWFLVEADDGTYGVLHQRLCRDKGESRFRLLEENNLSVREVMSEGGKLAKDLWYAMPH
jgi:hypothetical protein